MFEKDQKKIAEIIESKSTFIFDFDGVLADSVNIKTSSFFELYKEYGDQVANQVVDHHKENGGMSRFDKFEYYHKNFLNIELNRKGLQELSEKFSSLVVDSVISSPEIRGADKFLRRYCLNNKSAFVNSATPQKEIQQIITQRGMDKYFTCVYGSPSSKLDNLKSIMSRYNITPDQTVFFGDALADFNAADSFGCKFVGIGEDIERVLTSSLLKPRESCGFLKNFEMLV